MQKNIIIGLLLSLLFLGCSSSETNTENIEAKLVQNKSLTGLSLKNQFEKQQTLNKETKTLIFAFSKDMGHTCNDFFETKGENYLKDNKAEFIADVSGAPSLIRSMFILPGLKDFKHTVLVIDDKNIAAAYKKGLDAEKIIIVSLNDGTITSIKSIQTAQELQASIEVK